MNGAWKTIGVALEATTAGYTGGMLKAAAVTDKFGESAAKARLEAEKPPSAAGWEAFATKTEALGKKMTKNVTVPILAFGAAAVAAAVQVDGAYHTIEQRTGATGAKLQGLKHDFDEVNKTSGASMAHIADVMSQFNQRLGLSGQPLQTFTKDFLVLERVAGAGAPTVEQAATVMVAWKVATDDQAATLDKLFVASQRTGVPMNTLIDDVTRFAPQMRAAGLSIDHTTVLMASLEKAGAPVSKVMMGVNTFLGHMGADGPAAFEKIIAKASEMDKTVQGARDATAMLEDKTTGFGLRAGVVLDQLIKDGRLSGKSFDELSKQIADSQGQIQKVGDATVPLSVRMKQAWKSIELAIAPIGNIILPDLMDALHGIVPVVGGIAGAFDKLPHSVQVWGVGLLAAAALAGPLLTVGSKIATAVVSIGSAATTAGLEVTAFAETAVAEMGVLGAALGLVVLPLTAIGAAWYALHQDAQNRKADAQQVRDWSRSVISDVKATGVSVQSAFQADVFGKFNQDQRDFLDQHHVTMADLARGLTLNGDAWDKWKDRTAKALGVSSDMAPIIEHAVFDRWKKAYDAAAVSTRGLTTEQVKVVTALVSTGATMKAATTDAELLDQAMGDKGFAKAMGQASLTQDQFAAGARTMGMTVKDAIAAFKVDPKAWKQQLDDTYSFMKKVSDNFSASGALSNLPADLVKKGAAGLKLYFTQAITDNQKFSDNLRTATARGLNPQAITDLMIAGPEKAGPILEQLAGKHGQTLINMVNVFQAAIAKQTILAADQARLLFDATQGPKASQQRVADLPAAMKISAVTNAGTTPLTANQVAWMTGLDPATVQRVATEAGLGLARGLNNALDSHPATPTLNTDPAHKQLKTLQYTVNKTTGQVTVGATPIPANTELAKLLKAIGHSRGDVTLDADQQIAVVKLQALIDAINNSKGKVILDADPGPADQHIKTLGEEIGRIPFVGSALAASLKYQATDPRLVSQGAPTHKADGGIEHHTAQIAPAGAWRVWAEPETGGESYIPLAPSKRSRSIDIWHKTGKLLGVHGFADGGTAWVDESAIAAPAERALGKFLALEQATAASGAPGAPWNGSVGSIAAAQAFAAAQVGKPYSWGAVGPNAYDCSGYWSAIVNVLEGRHPYSRLFTSATLPGVAGSLGLSAGGGGPLSIGDKPGSHVAGTINGVNYEATPPFVRSGPHARGSGSSFFSRQFHIGGSSGLGGGFGGAPSATGGDPGATLFGNGGIVWHGNNFDVGGPLWPGWNAVRNDTGRVEHVVPTGHGGGHGGGVTYAPRVEVKILAPVYGIDDLNAAITDGVHATFRDEYPKIVHEVRRQEDSRR